MSKNKDNSKKMRELTPPELDALKRQADCRMLATPAKPVIPSDERKKPLCKEVLKRDRKGRQFLMGWTYSEMDGSNPTFKPLTKPILVDRTTTQDRKILKKHGL